MESIISKCIEQLLGLMNHVKNVGIVVEIISELAQHGEEVVDKEKL